MVPRKLLKSLIACLATALLGPILMTGLSLLIFSTTTDGFLSVRFVPALLLEIYFRDFCVLLALLIALWIPAQAVLQRFRHTGVGSLASVGSLFGLTTALLCDYLVQTEAQQGVGPMFWAFDRINWRLCLYGSALGMSLSSLSWVIRRPDKDVS